MFARAQQFVNVIRSSLLVKLVEILVMKYLLLVLDDSVSEAFCTKENVCERSVFMSLISSIPYILLKLTRHCACQAPLRCTVELMNGQSHEW